jgi:hypothetical protein
LILHSFKDITSAEFWQGLPPDEAPALRAVTGWTRSYLMSDHPELGRTGNVCPFTSMGARLDTLRFGVSNATSKDAPRIHTQLLELFEQFDEIPHPRKAETYRAILVGFPNCNEPEGLAALAKAQKSLRLLSFRRARMIGLFHPEADEPGLWNPAFRPLRSPIPVIALRSLVVEDAAFVMRHPLLAPAYLLNFPLAGPRQLAARILLRG